VSRRVPSATLADHGGRRVGGRVALRVGVAGTTPDDVRGAGRGAWGWARGAWLETRIGIRKLTAEPGVNRPRPPDLDY
jgi:hypothetical protein